MGGVNTEFLLSLWYTYLTNWVLFILDLNKKEKFLDFTENTLNYRPIWKSFTAVNQDALQTQEVHSILKRYNKT